MRCQAQQFPHAQNVERAGLTSTRTMDVPKVRLATRIVTGYASSANSNLSHAPMLRIQSRRRRILEPLQSPEATQPSRNFESLPGANGGCRDRQPQ